MRLEKRTLVVDDDDAIRALVTTVLRRRGLAVDTARHGAEAMERLAGRRYGLVILDLMMPRVSGYEVLDQLGTFAPSVRPLVLVLTAGLEPKAFDPDIVIGTIHKPFDIELLVDTVLACLAALHDSQRLDGQNVAVEDSVDRDRDEAS
jgi:DNA-binding response OmpR family regulator